MFPLWLQAGFWGLLAGSALLVGAAAGYFASVPQRLIAAVMAFGSGVLISALSFELMEEAVRHGDFKIFYQPLVDVTTGKVCSFEALLRWPHETRGLIAPDTFVPIDEETGLIINIGEWVLREACKQAALWPTGINIAVNLSPLQFRNPSLIGSVVGADVFGAALA